MGKRVSSAAGSPAKRAKAEVSARIRQVEKVLLDVDLSSEVPMESREMLAHGASCALRSAVEERHEMQEKVLGRIREALADIVDGLSAKVAEATAVVEKQEASLEGLQAQLRAAAAELTEAEGAVSAQGEKVQACAEPLSTAEKELRAAKAGLKVKAKERDSLTSEKNKLSGIEEGGMKPLLEGMLTEPKELSKATTKLTREMLKLGAESALMVSVPAVLAKKPEERQGFDTMVLASLKKVLDDALAANAARLATNEGATEDLSRELAAKEEAAEKARAGKDVEVEQLQRSERTRDEKGSAKAALENSIEECKSDLEACRVALETAEAKVSSFKEVCQGLEDLAERSSAEPENVAAA